MLLATYLAQSHKPQSIKLYFSAIRMLHLKHGLPDPMRDALNLCCLMRGIKRVHGKAADPHLPITPSLLRSFRSLLNLSYHDHLTLWVALLLAFFGFLRSSELLSQKHSDLHRTSQGYQVHIRQSKTDPFRSGTTVNTLPSGDPHLCTVTTLNSYLASQVPSDSTLFCLQIATLLRQRLNHLIRVLASHFRVDSQRCSSHSFQIRAALAAVAAVAVIPDWRIQALGCSSSDCYKCYIRLPRNETDSVASALVRAPT